MGAGPPVEDAGEDLTSALNVRGLELTDQDLVILAEELPELHEDLTVLLAVLLSQPDVVAVSIFRGEEG